MSTAASRRCTVPPRGKQNRLSKGPIEEDGKISKEYEINTKLSHEKTYDCDLNLKPRYKWV